MIYPISNIDNPLRLRIVNKFSSLFIYGRYTLLKVHTEDTYYRIVLNKPLAEQFDITGLFPKYTYIDILDHEIESWMKWSKKQLTNYLAYRFLSIL